jgi:hypothetical protein
LHREAGAQIQVAIAALVGHQRTGDASGVDDLAQRVVDRRLHVRMAGVAGVAHRLRQVGRGDVEDVDVLHRQDLRQVVDRLDLLDQDAHQRLLVGALVVVGDAVRPPPAEHAALADGSELGPLHHPFGRRLGRHVGHDDGAGAAVQRAPDQPRLVGIDAHNRRHAP